MSFSYEGFQENLPWFSHPLSMLPTFCWNHPLSGPNYEHFQEYYLIHYNLDKYICWVDGCGWDGWMDGLLGEWNDKFWSPVCTFINQRILIQASRVPHSLYFANVSLEDWPFTVHRHHLYVWSFQIYIPHLDKNPLFHLAFGSAASNPIDPVIKPWSPLCKLNIHLFPTILTSSLHFRLILSPLVF